MDPVCIWIVLRISYRVLLCSNPRAGKLGYGKLGYYGWKDAGRKPLADDFTLDDPLLDRVS